MAPQAELYDYRVFGKTGDHGGDEAIAMSIRQAVQDGCQIINMSLRVSYPIVPAVESAVKFAAGKGVVMVCAAGNSGDGDPTTNEMFAYPARWHQTISVAAVKKSSGVRITRLYLKILLYTTMSLTFVLSCQWLTFQKAILKLTSLVLAST